MSFTLCTSAAIVTKAGAFANSTAVASSAILQQFSDEAEGEFCASTHKDWVSDYSAVDTNIKPQIAKAVSSRAAMSLIGYDTSGYQKTDVQLTLDILVDEFEKGIATLKNVSNQTFS